MYGVMIQVETGMTEGKLHYFYATMIRVDTGMTAGKLHHILYDVMIQVETGMTAGKLHYLYDVMIQVETGMTVYTVSWIPCSNRMVAGGSSLQNKGLIQVESCILV